MLHAVVVLVGQELVQKMVIVLRAARQTAFSCSSLKALKSASSLGQFHRRVFALHPHMEGQPTGFISMMR